MVRTPLQPSQPGENLALAIGIAGIVMFVGLFLAGNDLLAIGGFVTGLVLWNIYQKRHPTTHFTWSREQ